MLASSIIPLIPDHITYCEPFFGGGAIFFAKPKSKVEIINDLNQFVVNFYSQVKTNFTAVQRLIQSTPFSRRRWRDAYVMYQHPHLFSDLDKAWAFYVVCNQGYAGKIGAWGYGITSDSCEKKEKNKRESFDFSYHERLDQVQIECTDALKLIQARDKPTTFFYLDPPYFNSNCGHYEGYSERDFTDLLELCSKMEGKFLLSSYPSNVLTEFASKNGWYQKSFSQVVNVSPNRKQKIEVLTANYNI